MEPENLDIESIMDARRETVEQTIQPVGIDELKSLGEKVFPFLDHPGVTCFSSSSRRIAAVRSITPRQMIRLKYCPDKEAGMWFLPQGGVEIQSAEFQHAMPWNALGTNAKQAPEGNGSNLFVVRAGNGHWHRRYCCSTHHGAPSRWNSPYRPQRVSFT
jgi:hypothetical protein